ncbi:hypothetical protein [Nocardia sp. NPDC051981]|uniref:hypothetical protein n=1 Tax=Nocardia sp. NPDC051981 TaxID=3155417 RepID=UPI00341750FB
MHVDIDHHRPLAAILEAALLGSWLVVVARTTAPGNTQATPRTTGARGEGTEPHGDWALVLTLLRGPRSSPDILPVPSANRSRNSPDSC